MIEHSFFHQKLSSFLTLGILLGVEQTMVKDTGCPSMDGFLSPDNDIKLSPGRKLRNQSVKALPAASLCAREDRLCSFSMT